MATFGIILRFQGGTREQYENTLKVVHPDSGEALPDSQLLHLAGPTQDGWSWRSTTRESHGSASEMTPWCPVSPVLRMVCPLRPRR
jgi:hypothetical protein